MLLTLILCSRNDEYMGNSRWRLETTLNSLGESVRRHGRTHDVEVLVADWGSDVPLADVVNLEPAAAEIVSFLTIPPAVARAHQGDSPFPEVLALNAAARRARGEYIGRIDQDTIVGDWFFRWIFDAAMAREERRETTLWFANRREVPFRLAVRCPERRHIGRFIRLFGRWLPVRRGNKWFAHEYWSSSVGIWLAHRRLWEECRGYDERMIYYNWMETDMIRRLRQAYPLADLGDLTGYDFYHLEHYHPRLAATARAHVKKNPDIDRLSRPPVMRPNSHTWGLGDCEIAARASATAYAPQPRPGMAAVRDAAAFAAMMLRLAPALVVDSVAILCARGFDIVSRRARAAAQALAGRPMLQWPETLWKLWHTRRVDRAR
jgi:hypothetical protein